MNLLMNGLGRKLCAALGACRLSPFFPSVYTLGFNIPYASLDKLRAGLNERKSFQFLPMHGLLGNAADISLEDSV